MEKIKWSGKITNEEVLERTGEKRTLEINSNLKNSQLNRTYSKNKLPSL